MKKTLVLIVAIVLCFSFMTACGNKSGKYPTQSIELVIPASPGGGSDIMGRLLVEIIQEKNCVLSLWSQ
ncbi:MAG: hypothetical protein GX022_01645 [Clostridiaceae bacterium]|nr:hypothetical protein [Clostridiaceae bacterium]